MSKLALNSIGHAYFGRTVLDNVTLDIAPGELVALVGPSGCGKSTLAHIAAGLTEPLRGRITRNYSRHAMIFQEPRLMPWATAAQNIHYPLRLARCPRNQRIARITEVAALVALEPADLQKYPIELSGGMRQRVAIARAMVINPDFIFFDEPFTALDVALKRRMQDLVLTACSTGEMAGLFITHDLMEAARMSDRIAVLDHKGNAISGTRTPPGTRGQREDSYLFNWVQTLLRDDPLFRHIHDVDERQIS